MNSFDNEATCIITGNIILILIYIYIAYYST